MWKFYCISFFAYVVYFHIDIVHACTHGNGIRFPGCNATIEINWYEIPPYVYRSKNNITGILRNVTETLVGKCCGECVQFHYNLPLWNNKEVISSIGANSSGLTFPIYGNILSTKFETYPYIPVVESPGIIYITKKPTVGKASELLLENITASWPILILIFMFAMVFGIVTWATDSYINPEQFPSPFFKGAWDGFWWAMVSMTTVGFGDKAPIGKVARIIAFVWTLMGLVLIAVFNGFISTSSTAAALGGDIELFGQTVVAFDQSQEQRFGIKNNAEVDAVSTMEQFFNRIINGDADGGLIDSYTAGFYKKEFDSRGLIVGTVFDYQFTYGFVLSNGLNDKQIQDCIWVQHSLQESRTIKLIETSMSALPELTPDELAQFSTAILDANSSIFQEFITVICIMFAVMCLCGAVWEVFYNRPRLAALAKQSSYPEVREEAIVAEISVYGTMDELIRAQNMELEKAMIEEINAFVTAYNRREEDYRTVISDPIFRNMLPNIMNDQELHFVEDT